MSAAPSKTISMRHPWIDVFLADPTMAYDRFIRGYAEIAPYERAESPDVARMVFGPLNAEDEARVQLGAAIIAWLDTRRREPIPSDRRRRGRVIREISESFEIIRTLEPGASVLWAHDNRIRLLDWTSRLVDGPARDARAAFLLTLAVTQPAEESDDLTRLWLDLCREAGGALPTEYLHLGLMGLRRLPKISVEAPLSAAAQPMEERDLGALAHAAVSRGRYRAASLVDLRRGHRCLAAAECRAG
jgi:hypothetical protein